MAETLQNSIDQGTVTDSSNTFLGYNCGNASLTGTNNTGIGALVMPSNIGGNQNTGVGYQALNALVGSLPVSGMANTAVGYNALTGCTTGMINTAIGVAALAGAIDAYNNTGVGNACLSVLAHGSWNIAIGVSAGGNYTNAESNNLIIGSAGVASESNVLRIGTYGSGTGQQNLCYIAAIYPVTAATGSRSVFVDTNGQLGAIVNGAAGTVLTSNGAGSTPSWQTPAAGGFTWSAITADQTAAINNGYICNKAGTLTLTLPASAAVGSIIEVTGINTATGWKIAQGTGQIIYFGTTNTTVTTGYLQSSAIRDSIKMVCIVTDTTWQVISSLGNITVV